jgi:hypothetical protein
MDAAWWALPGPSRFLADVVGDIRRGLNVIITPPPCSPVTDRVLEPLVRRFESLHFISIDSADISDPISESLHERLGVNPKPGQLASPAHLAEALPDRNVIFVDGLDATNSPLWLEFLSQYQHGCNGKPAHKRSVFCVAISVACGVEPKQDIVLALRRFEANFNRIDGVLQMENLLPRDGRTAIERDLLVAVGTELAGCDGGLAKAIVESGRDFLTAPIPVLKRHGESLGWSPAEVEGGGLTKGIEEFFDGKRRWHSSALALRNDDTALLRRIWHGQIRALFPFIEEQRIALANVVEPFLPLPVDTSDGRADHAIDLEVGQMLYHLRGRRVPPSIWDAISCLRDMRNDLAHVRPVAPELLRSAAFRRMAENPLGG